ncbi:unnamed protein product [Mucor fragilis]
MNTSQPTLKKSPNVSGGDSNADEMAAIPVALAAMKKEIANLMVKIASAGDKPSSEVAPLMATLGEKKAAYTALIEMLALLNSDGPSLVANSPHVSPAGIVSPANFVPDGLLTFQWPGFIRDDKCEIFADVEGCLGRFENVLISHSVRNEN